MYPNAEPPKREGAGASPKRQTRAEKQKETRRRLLDAAARVFIRRGFQGASIEAITAEAGFTRGAFYSNFESKEQLFVELLQNRLYDRYREIVSRPAPDLTPAESLRLLGQTLVDLYQDGEGRWLFELWFEFLAHAARHDEFRSLAATFWSGTRAIGTQQIADAYAERGLEPPIDPKHLATAGIALDIGLAVQNLVDPEDVPLGVYPPLYELIFGQLIEPTRVGEKRTTASRGAGSKRRPRQGSRASRP
jgi:AcrR family transcriptional regulator